MNFDPKIYTRHCASVTAAAGKTEGTEMYFLD